MEHLNLAIGKMTVNMLQECHSIFKASCPHNIAHYVFYGKKRTSLVQWLVLSDMFRLYSFKLEKTGEKGRDSDHGLAQEFYLHEGNKENNEKLSHHDH